MKGFETKKAYLLITLMLTVFVVLSGCSGGGEFGGGHWIAPGAAPTVTAVAPLPNTPDVPVNTKIITAAFSQAMAPSSLNTASFTLTCNGTQITGGGAVNYLADGNMATLPLPAADLPSGAACTARITTGARDVTGVALANDFVWNFITSSVQDTARPVVISTVPATTIPGPTFGAPTNTAITAEFNEDMSPATIIAAGAFTVTGPGATPVTAAVPGVTYDIASRTATFHPAAVLTPGVTYTVTIKGIGANPARDLAGNALAGITTLPLTANDYVWSFTTGAAADTTRPLVTATIPATTIPGPTLGAATNTAITALFNEDMAPATVTAPGAFTVTGPGLTPVPGAVPAVTYDVVSRTATFHPAAALTPGVTYTVTIRGLGANPAMDLAGNALAGKPALPLAANDYVWSFTTGATADTTRPMVTVTVPATTTPGPTPGASTTTSINAVFNKDMAPATITAPGAFTVTGPGATPVIAAVPAVTYDVVSRTATFHPVAALTPNTTFTATIKGIGANPARDTAGNALAGNPALPLVANDYVWSFTTGASVNLGPGPVNLGSAGTFRILAGSALTNTGVTTSVNGDVGVSPGSTVNGFTQLVNIVPPFQLHAGDPIAATAKVDLLAAYNDAQSRSTAAISLPGQLGGLTLAPGLYVNSTSSGISGTGPQGILTLDGQGDSNAVWIFKMGSTLVTDPGTSIVCTNGCTAENVIWQVGSSATLGVNSIFYGTILSDISISMNTGATLHGRALTRVGAVTLQTSQIVP